MKARRIRGLAAKSFWMRKILPFSMGKSPFSMGKLTLNDNFQKTLWLFNIAMEAMSLIEIDGLPINSMVDLSMVM